MTCGDNKLFQIKIQRENTKQEKDKHGPLLTGHIRRVLLVVIGKTEKYIDS